MVVIEMIYAFGSGEKVAERIKEIEERIAFACSLGGRLEKGKIKILLQESLSCNTYAKIFCDMEGQNAAMVAEELKDRFENITVAIIRAEHITSNK